MFVSFKDARIQQNTKQNTCRDSLFKGFDSPFEAHPNHWMDCTGERLFSNWVYLVLGNCKSVGRNFRGPLVAGHSSIYPPYTNKSIQHPDYTKSLIEQVDYMRSGALTPNICSPFRMVTFTALSRNNRACDNGISSLITRCSV